MYETHPDMTDRTDEAKPEPNLEKIFIDEYIKNKGYLPQDIYKLPEAEAKKILTEASRYASGKLAELETRAKMVKEIHDASKSAEAK